MIPAGCETYSPIRHLAWSRWLNRDPARCWMTMWTAYYDASGSERDPSMNRVVVAGLIANERRWLRFETEWAKVLKDPRFKAPYLHMKDFAHSNPPYEDWKGDEARRGTFLALLTRVAKRWVNRMWIMHIPKRTFESVNAVYKLQERVGGPYTIGAITCLGHTRHWVRTKKANQPLHHVFEEGDDGQKLFTSIVEMEGEYPSIRPKIDKRTGEWFKPFQAADFAAYEFGLELERADDKKRTRSSRRSWMGIWKDIPHEVREHNKETLSSICEQRPDLFPRRV